jgi:hypothetical protein
MRRIVRWLQSPEGRELLRDIALMILSRFAERRWRE